MVPYADESMSEASPAESADPESGLEGKVLLGRYRVERVFSSRAPIREGQEVWVRHQTCNSLPPSADAVGARLIVFFDGYLGQLMEDYCSLRLSAWSRIPGSLLAARRRWLQRWRARCRSMRTRSSW